MSRDEFLYEMEMLIYSVQLDTKKVMHYYQSQREEIYRHVETTAKDVEGSGDLLENKKTA